MNKIKFFKKLKILKEKYYFNNDFYFNNYYKLIKKGKKKINEYRKKKIKEVLKNED